MLLRLYLLSSYTLMIPLYMKPSTGEQTGVRGCQPRGNLSRHGWCLPTLVSSILNLGSPFHLGITLCFTKKSMVLRYKVALLPFSI